MIKTRYAHRGYHHKPAVPENSLPAFRLAIERGWGAELDVHLLKDGGLAVFHDSQLKRCTGVEGIIEDHTLDELKALRLEGTDNPIPEFRQVLDLFEGKAPLIIELKTYGSNHRALAESVCRALDSYHGDFCIESFDPRALIDVRKLRPGFIRGQLAQDFVKNPTDEVASWQRGLLTDMRLNFLTRPDFIAYKYEDRDNPALRRCVKRGMQEVCWTIRTKKAMEEIEKDGGIAIFEGFDPDEE